MKALTEAPQLENNTRRSSSTTEGLKHKHSQVRVWQHFGRSATLLQDHLRDVGQVERGRWRENVGVVLRARLLEAVQWRATIVFGQTLVLVAFTRQLDAAVLGQRNTQRFPVKLLATQMAHGCDTDSCSTFSLDDIIIKNEPMLRLTNTATSTQHVYKMDRKQRARARVT